MTIQLFTIVSRKIILILVLHTLFFKVGSSTWTRHMYMLTKGMQPKEKFNVTYAKIQLRTSNDIR